MNVQIMIVQAVKMGSNNKYYYYNFIFIVIKYIINRYL